MKEHPHTILLIEKPKQSTGWALAARNTTYDGLARGFAPVIAAFEDLPTARQFLKDMKAGVKRGAFQL